MSTPQEGAAWAASGAFPRPLYHATVSGPAIQMGGLLSLHEVKQRGLGGQTLGMNMHSGYVSTSPLFEGAVRLAALMQARNEMKTRPFECVQWWIDKYVRRLKQYDSAQHDLVMAYWRDIARRSQYVTNFNTGELFRLTPEQAALEASQMSGGGLGQLLNWVRSDLTADAHPEYTFPFFGGLGGDEESATIRDPRSIGVVTLYARVDGVFQAKTKGHFWCASTRGGRPDKGFRAIGQHATATTGMDEDEIQEVMVDGAKGDEHYLYIKIPEGEARGGGDAYEILVCSQDTTVVKFQPVLDWRTILDPKNLPAFLRLR